MKKLFVVRVGNYWPEICRYTIPTIEFWAKKNNWQYVEIKDKYFNGDFSPTVEKLQIAKLGAESDWNLLIDADVMIRPDLYDMTNSEDPKIVRSSYGFPADKKFKSSLYFERDGRNQGISGGCVLSSRLTHDLWNNSPLQWAKDHCADRHIIDEFVISTNLARYGLKFDGINPTPDTYIVHFGDHAGDENKKKELVEKAKDLYLSWEAIWPLQKILQPAKS